MDAIKMKNKLRADLEKLRAPEGYFYAGIPNFKTLFGRDSLVVSWQLLKIDPSVARNTLRILASLQGKKICRRSEEEPGRIINEYVKFCSREGLKPKRLLARLIWGFPYYGSCDSTPLFIIISSFYLEETGDADFLKEIWPNIEMAAKWLRDFGDKDNDFFVEYQRKNPFGLYHQSWKDLVRFPHKISSPVAIVEMQGYSYLAYRKFSEMNKKLFGKARPEFENLAEKLKKEFNEKFWLDDFFAFCLDGEKKARKIYASNQGHLLFTGIIDGDRKIFKLVERLQGKDLWTPYGIRTLSSNDPEFNPEFRVAGPIWPNDNWIIHQGLKKIGSLYVAETLKENMLRALDTLGFAPECYVIRNSEIAPEKNACCPQAWSSTAFLNLLAETEN